MTLIATWFSAGRRAQHPPDPLYPLGVLADLSAGRPHCEVALQYPAPCVGKWLMRRPRRRDPDNPKLPPGWRRIDGATGRLAITEADAVKVIRSWVELERQWQETQQ